MTDGGTAQVEVEFRILGPVEARRNGAAIALGGPQQRRLLAALLTEPGHSITIDRLVDILWADSDPPDRARRTLMTYVSRLRLSIGVELLETVGPGYRLALPAGSVDSVRFTELLDSASRSSPTHQLALLGEALALWRGPAFGELASEWWARPAALRLDELRLIAREDRAAALLLTGEPDVAVSELEEMVAANPQRERTMLLYLRALSEAGRKAEALRAFHQYRDRLANETGLTPSEALVMLDRSIAGDDAGAVTRAGQALRGYVLHELLGEGAASQVYRGTQPGIGRDVAIKVIKPELADTPVFVQRFEVEAQIVSRLEHPHIVPLYDFWREPGGAFLVFRWMRGGSADRLVAESGAWSLGRVTRLLVEVGGALVAAHASGVVHGDVKPANVLVDEVDHHYLADFGIASEAEHDGARAATVDQFGLAATAWELLTGICPFAGVRGSRPVGYSTERTLPSMAPWCPDLPVALDLVLRQATAVREEDRFASLAGMIEAWLEGSGSRAQERRRADGRRPEVESAGTAPTPAANPYKGLRSFAESDADDFHGRTVLADELVQRVASSSFVVVIGPSGSGKSSLLHAGLIPRLRAAAARVVSVTPGGDPSDRLRAGLLGVAIADHGDVALAEQLRAVAAEGETELIVVVDQFEETWASAQAASQAEFLAALAAVPSGVRVVAAIRADHLDRPLSDSLVGPLVRDGAFLVTPLTRTELRQVITEPALSHRVLLEPGLADQIADDVAGARGALPMLQFALKELYRRQERGVMTVAAYRSMGGVSGAITSRAEELLAAFDESRQTAVRQLFERLVVQGDGADDSCRSARRSELAVGALLARLVTEQEDVRRLIVYDLADGRRLADVPAAATSVALSPDGRYVAAAGGIDGDVVVLTVDGTSIGSIDGRVNTSGRVLAATAAVTFDADGRMFVSSPDGAVRIIELPSLRPIGEVSRGGSIPPTTSLAVSADGATLFGNGYTDPSDNTAESASTVQAWDLVTGSSLWSVDDVRECVRIVLVPADETLRCAGFFGGLTAYSAATGQAVGTSPLDAQLGTVAELAVTPAGAMIAVSEVDSLVGEWRFDGSGPVTTPLGPATTPYSYLSSDRLMVYRLDQPGLPYLPSEILDVRTGQVTDSLDGFGPSTWAGPNRVASVFLDGTIGFYDVDSRVRAIADDPPRFPSPAVPAYARGAALLVVWHLDGTNTVVDATGEWSSIDLPLGLPRSASFSSDGTRLLMTDASGLSMYELQSGRRLLGPIEGVLEVGISANDVVATAGVDGTIEIRGLDDLQPVGDSVRLEGARVQDIEFDERGNVLVVRTTDAAHVIDVASRVALGGPIPTGRPDPDEGLAVSPDGLEMAIATTAGTATWSLDPLEWERAACRLAGRNLTRAEWQRYIGGLGDYRATCDEYVIDEGEAA